MRRASAFIALLGLALLPAGCGSEPAAGTPKKTEAAAMTPEKRDAGAIADLQASPKWTEPRCRWLETGAWVLAYPQETALYRAAYLSGFIEMEEVGQGNRIKPEPAWKITLTDRGKDVAATCSPTSKPTSWGVPVSRRRFISANYVGPDGGFGERTIYDVEFEWVPTEVGEQVKHVLTSHQTVEEGVFTIKVYMRHDPRLTNPGPNGWWVDAIDDRNTVQRK